MCPFVHCSIIYNSQDMETTKVSIDTRMAKDMYIHILLMEYYSAIKKERNFAICRNMDELGRHYAK